MNRIRRNKNLSPREAKAAELRSKRRRKAAFIALFCIAIIVFGGVLAAQQQFNKWHYSRQNAALSREIIKLEGERDRLLSEREMVTSVNGLKRSARKLGLLEPANTAEIASSSGSGNGSAARHTTSTKTNDRPQVQRTSMVEKRVGSDVDPVVSSNKKSNGSKPTSAVQR